MQIISFVKRVIKEQVKKMKYIVTESSTIGLNHSMPGGREISCAVVKTMKSGRQTVMDECPSEDMASKMFQTRKLELKEKARRNDGTQISLVRIRKISHNDQLAWDNQSYVTLKRTTITPYSKRYSATLKRMGRY